MKLFIKHKWLGRMLLFAKIGVLPLLAFSVGLAWLNAQDDAASISREYTIKAAYLYQFSRYVEWPAESFSNSLSPFVIGVIKGDPITADLEQIAQIEKVQDRPIELRQFSSPADVQACHILFLPASLPSEAQTEIIGRLRGRNVLLVGDTSLFLEKGGMVRFVVEGNKVRIYIARKAAERAGLNISAKLLQVAQVVD